MAENKVIRTIGVLTSGGDAPGMNAAIRAVVRTALGKGIKVRGIRKGYQGLLDEEIIDLTARDVSDTIQRGGTILQTARCEEMRGYFIIVAAAVLFITLNARESFSSLFMAVHHVLFQVASIITTTGYATVDFDKWPEFSKYILLLLMMIGACAGSTGGGMKVSRVMIAFKEAVRELGTVIHPRSVKVIKYEGKTLAHAP